MENQEAFEYSQRLLQAAEAAMSFGQPDKPQQVRDLGFPQGDHESVQPPLPFAASA
ncbi:MAG: hypothetical protein ACQERT_15210 [Thermodesulfobacteriota bacterium]